LIDTATGALLADEIGKEPRFSPTGRFVIATVKKNFAIGDSIDGKVTRTQVGSGWRGEADIAWDDRDSFLISHDDYGEGEVDGYVLGPLEENFVEKHLNTDEGGILSFCLSGDEYIVKIDLENNIADCGSPSSLTVHVPGKKLREADDKDLLSSGLVVPYTAPTRWEMIDGLKLTHLFLFEAEEKNFAATTKQFMVRPILVSKSDEQGLPASNDPLQVATRGLRKLNLPEAELLLRKEQRLRDFGFEVNPGAPLAKLDQSAAFKKIEGSSGNLQFREDKKIRFMSDFLHDGAYACGEVKPIATGGVDIGVSQSSLRRADPSGTVPAHAILSAVRCRRRHFLSACRFI
jgi:hypothetical protein